MEDQAQETGIDSTERSGNAVRDCPNCEVFRKEIQDKNAKLEKIKAKNCKLKSEKDELNEKLVSNFLEYSPMFFNIGSKYNRHVRDEI